MEPLGSLWEFFPFFLSEIFSIGCLGSACVPMDVCGVGTGCRETPTVAPKLSCKAAFLWLGEFVACEGGLRESWGG